MAGDLTTQLQQLLNRMNAGEGTAQEELVVRACERLRRLTRTIFHDFPRVHRFEDTGDVLHNAMLRLLRRLKAVSVPSVADFFSLAAREIRLELIDLARHYYGPAGAGRKQAGLVCGDRDGRNPAGGLEQGDSSCQPDRLMFWTEFHQRIESLPVGERVIFDLLWYHEMTQEEAAVVLNMSLSSVKRHWFATRMRLQDFLQDAEGIL